MPHVQRYERIVPAISFTHIDTSPMNLLPNLDQNSIQVPIQVYVLPKIVTPFIGSPTVTLQLGAIQVSSVSGLIAALNANKAFNLLLPERNLRIDGLDIAAVTGADLTMSSSSPITGGDGLIKIVMAYQIVYPL